MHTSCVIGGLPWKHDFMRRADLRNQHTTLHVLCTRHPYEWISSMHRHPYYAYMHQASPMIEFLTREWISFYQGAGGRANELKNVNNKQSTTVIREVLTNQTLGPREYVEKRGEMPANEEVDCAYLQDGREGAMCKQNNTLYECTLVPGFEANGWLGVQGLGDLAPNCKSGSQSLAACLSHYHLCTWPDDSRPWTVTPSEVFGSNWTGGKLSAKARNQLTAEDNAKWDAWSARVSPKP